MTQVFKKLQRAFSRLGAGLNRWIMRAPPKISHERSDWAKSAQEGELRFHLTNNWRQSQDFMEQTISLFDHFGFSRDEFAGKTVIDLGAGSRLRTKYFDGARIVAIEPLADRFMSAISWCDLGDAQSVYSRPAEELIEPLCDSADLVISINVLDHCFDFEKILENVSRYMKDRGQAFLSFDKHDIADEMHPLELTESICQDIFARVGLVVEHESIGAGSVLQTYGHGDYCLNYWLRKPQRLRPGSE